MYNYLNYVVIFVCCIFILTVLFISSQKKQNIYFAGQLFFQAMLISVAMILISDIFMWICDGNSFHGARTIHIVASIIYFSMSTVPGFFFAIYTSARLHRHSRSIRKILPFILTPVIINFILTILSIWFGFIFTISSNNDYTRGPLMWLMAVFSYANIAFAFVMMLLNRSKIARNEIISIVFFSIIPIICNVFQMIYFGLNMLWPGVTLSCLMLYLYSFNDSIRLDPLTGVYNRRQLEQYLYVLFYRKSKSKVIVGIMLDLDNFKGINDKYGHAEGDKALGSACTILKKSFNKFFISRYAGDEFVVILETENPQLETYYANLKKEEEFFNKNSNLPYKLTFSIGAVTANSNDIDASAFIKQIDDKMYEDKRSRQIISF